MRYRKPQTLADNVREARTTALGASAAGLGDSSIDDDGSLDVTSDDTTVAKVGHSGSRSGLLIPNRSGGWLTVQEDAQRRADAALEAAQAAIDDLAATVAALRRRISSLESDVSTLQTQRENLRSDVNALENEVHAARGTWSRLDGRLDSYGSRITTLESK